MEKKKQTEFISEEKEKPTVFINEKEMTALLGARKEFLDQEKESAIKELTAFLRIILDTTKNITGLLGDDEQARERRALLHDLLTISLRSGDEENKQYAWFRVLSYNVQRDIVDICEQYRDWVEYPAQYCHTAAELSDAILSRRKKGISRFTQDTDKMFDYFYTRTGSRTDSKLPYQMFKDKNFSYILDYQNFFQSLISFSLKYFLFTEEDVSNFIDTYETRYSQPALNDRDELQKKILKQFVIAFITFRDEVIRQAETHIGESGGTTGTDHN